MHESTGSVYDRLGGAAAVREAVDRFYERVLADDALVGYFTGVDMGRLRRHQALMLTQLLGGPAAYDGRDLTVAHSHLGITPEDYGRVGEHLLGVLRELGAGADAVEAISAALDGARDGIVTAERAVG